jgi:hypothetical protein
MQPIFNHVDPASVATAAEPFMGSLDRRTLAGISLNQCSSMTTLLEFIAIDM